MKALIVGLAVLLGGCSGEALVSSESVKTTGSGFAEGITIGEAACGDYSEVDPSKAINLQVQKSAEKYIGVFLEAAEVWGLTVGSVSVLEDSAAYNSGKMLLSVCPEVSGEDIAKGRWDMGGFQVSRPDFLDTLSADLQVTIFSHELGHNQGLLDSVDEDGIMSSAAVYGGVREPSASEWSMVEGYWNE